MSPGDAAAENQLLLRSCPPDHPDAGPAQPWDEQVPPPGRDAALLAVVPIPGTGTSLAIVGYAITTSAADPAAGPPSGNPTSPGQPAAGCGRVADFHRRLGVSPTPEHAFTSYKPVCHTRYSAASCLSSRWPRTELVADAVLGDQPCAVTWAELAPEPAHVHVHGAAVPRHRPAILAEGAVPDSLD